MEKTLPLYLGPSVIGSVTLDGNDRSLHALARTYATLSGICRAYIKSSRASLLVGVLSPDGSSFSAERTFSKNDLTNAEVSPEEISFAYAICKERESFPAFDTWKPCESLSEDFFRNAPLSSLANFRGALVDDAYHPSKIAVPLFGGKPFPRADVLCLVTPAKIGDEFFGVLGISDTGDVKKL